MTQPKLKHLRDSRAPAVREERKPTAKPVGAPSASKRRASATRARVSHETYRSAANSCEPTACRSRVIREAATGRLWEKCARLGLANRAFGGSSLVKDWPAAGASLVRCCVAVLILCGRLPACALCVRGWLRVGSRSGRADLLRPTQALAQD